MLASHFVDERGELRGDCPVDAVVLDECRRRGLPPPNDVFELLELFMRRCKTEQRWFPGWVAQLGADREFKRLWRSVRLRCEWCDGYLVVRRHNSRARLRFAGCTNYMADDCCFTMRSRQYACEKARVVLALFTGEQPERAYTLK